MSIPCLIPSVTFVSYLHGWHLCSHGMETSFPCTIVLLQSNDSSPSEHQQHLVFPTLKRRKEGREGRRRGREGKGGEGRGRKVSTSLPHILKVIPSFPSAHLSMPHTKLQSTARPVNIPTITFHTFLPSSLCSSPMGLPYVFQKLVMELPWWCSG